MYLNLNKFHPLSEKMVDIICTRVQNQDKAFFRPEVAYYMAKVASNMHATVHTLTNNVSPVNAFVMAFAESGYGKGYSQNIIEEDFLGGFEEQFLDIIYPEAAKKAITAKAKALAHKTGMCELETEADLTRAFGEMGDFFYSFPEGTSPALKQLCSAITYAGAGAASLEMDEIGFNIGANVDIMSTLLELYDVGKTKDKLIKSTKENRRNKKLKGRTPSNVFAFGTPVSAFDGGRAEEVLVSFLKAGYGRRSFFAYGDPSIKHDNVMDSAEAYAALTDKQLVKDTEAIHEQFTALAKLDLVGQKLFIGAEAELFRSKYNQYCHERARGISEYRPVERAEMLHRVSKVTKLAGAYAFVDGVTDITIDHLEYAIALAEVSGDCLYKIMNQPKAYMRLAKFLCEYGAPVTQADLVEHLSFFNGSIAHKKDLMSLAIAYAHRNAMAIKTFEEAGVTMWQGETLEPIDMNNIIVSTSDHVADNYSSVCTTIVRLADYCSRGDANICNHHFKNGQIDKGNRSKATTLSGTNTVVFDIDNTSISPELIHGVLKPYNHIIYTTKSHTKESPRYRIILILSHLVRLDDVEYKRFAKNIAKWLPVNVDLPSIQREHKWRVYEGATVWYQDQGKNLDVMPYYPNTKEAEDTAKFNTALVTERIKGMKKWVIHTAAKGSRNNTLYAYTSFLKEYTNLTPERIKIKVHEINAKLKEPLEDIELDATILQSLK